MEEAQDGETPEQMDGEGERAEDGSDHEQEDALGRICWLRVDCQQLMHLVALLGISVIDSWAYILVEEKDPRDFVKTWIGGASYESWRSATHKLFLIFQKHMDLGAFFAFQ